MITSQPGSLGTTCYHANLLTFFNLWSSLLIRPFVVMLAFLQQFDCTKFKTAQW